MLFYPFTTFFVTDMEYRGTKNSWDQRCVGVMAMLNLNQLVYTVQPLPAVTKIDLASVFFSSAKLREEGEGVSFRK